MQAAARSIGRYRQERKAGQVVVAGRWWQAGEEPSRFNRRQRVCSRAQTRCVEVQVQGKWQEETERTRGGRQEGERGECRAWQDSEGSGTGRQAGTEPGRR